jgi:hypothetical protein
MKITLTLAALALSLTPALASPCSGTKDNTAASCLPGYSWDAATATCTATPSS